MAGAKSQMGHILMFNGAPIAWQSKPNPTVNLSTASGEIYAIANCIIDVTYVRNILDFIGYGQKTPTPIGTDATSALSFFDGVTSAKHRSIDTRIFYLREKVNGGFVTINKVHTDDNYADVTTKILYRAKHTKFLDQLIWNVWSATCEDLSDVTTPDKLPPRPTPAIATHDDNVPESHNTIAISTRRWLEIRDMLLHE